MACPRDEPFLGDASCLIQFLILETSWMAEAVFVHVCLTIDGELPVQPGVFS